MSGINLETQATVDEATWSYVSYWPAQTRHFLEQVAAKMRQNLMNGLEIDKPVVLLPNTIAE